MNIEELWREHKRFIVAVASGCAAYLVLLALIGSIHADTQKLRTSEHKLRTEVDALASAIVGREGFEKGLQIALDKQVEPSVRKVVEQRPGPNYATLEGESLFIAYGRVLQRLQLLHQRLAKTGVRCPASFGLVEQPPTDRLTEAMAATAVVERLLTVIGKTGVKNIEALQVGEVRFETLAQPPNAKEQLDSVLRRLPVTVRCLASYDVLRAFVQALQEPAHVFEITSLEIVKTEGDELEVALQLSALSLIAPASVAQRLLDKKGPSASPFSRRGFRRR